VGEVRHSEGWQGLEESNILFFSQVKAIGAKPKTSGAPRTWVTGSQFLTTEIPPQSHLSLSIQAECLERVRKWALRSLTYKRLAPNHCWPGIFVGPGLDF
jgi:hypothetical protein